MQFMQVMHPDRLIIASNGVQPLWLPLNFQLAAALKFPFLSLVPALCGGAPARDAPRPSVARQSLDARTLARDAPAFTAAPVAVGSR